MSVITIFATFASLLVSHLHTVLVPIAGIVIAVARRHQMGSHSRTAATGFALLISSGLVSILLSMWQLQAASSGALSESDVRIIGAVTSLSDVVAAIGMVFVLTSVFGIANVPQSASHEGSGQISGQGTKSRATAAFLAYALGGLGAHKFYLGKSLSGALYLVFCWTFVPVLVAFVEGTIYVAMGDDAFRRQYG
jgi:TM2 domain-containing membrane protein YozV